MKRLFILLGIIAVVGIAHAQQVTYKEAQTAAQNFFSKQQKSLVNCSYIAKYDHDTMFYVFNSSESFVIIAADKRCIPVLAFSDNNIFDQATIIEPVKMWLENYENQIHILKSSNQTASLSTLYAWNELLRNRKDFDNDIAFVSPLLTSKWGQGMEYNYYCPKDEDGTNGRAVTGCVATAMAQLMYYFRFPESGTGTYSYNHATYGNISADFGNAVYDYSAMTDAPKNINTAAALLIHHCGVAVDMVYGANSSGMYNHKAAYAMRTYFKFDPSTSYVFRDTCTLSWDSLIVSHLNKKIPLYYAGWSVPDTMGHAFVCDGYKRIDTNYYYHFNFGWDGYADGYYYTNALSPGGNNFNLAQEIIIHAYPDTALYTYPQKLITGTKILTDESGSFEDGSGRIENYANNMDYTWIVQPDLDSIQKIDFYIQYQIAENDTLFLSFNDANINDTVITNDSANMNVTLYGNQITVRLVSGSGLTKDGFYAYYACSIPTYCSPVQLITTASGKMEDGSGTKKYNSFTDCKKRLKINNAASITLHFTKFETEKDKDFLYVYDYASTNKDLLVSLSGNLGDTSFTFNTNTLFFVFTTDEQTTFDGWSLTYTSGMIGVNESSETDNHITLFPNPATDQLTIENEKFTMKSGQVYDSMGKEVKRFPVNATSTTLDISDLQKGIYFLKIETETGTVTKRFVKE